MAAPTSSLQARLAKLRSAFIEQIPSQLAESRDLLLEIAISENRTEPATQLKRIFHNLKGSGATFGLSSLSAEAEAAELLLEHLIQNPGDFSPEFATEVGQYISAIDRLAVQPVSSVEPTVGAPAVDKVAPAPTVQPMARKVIYVCDDDVHQAEQIETQLRAFAYDVSVFHTPDALRTAVAQTRPDAIIMDVVFPEGDDAGIAVIRDLQPADGPPLPTVFISGRSDFPARLDAVKAGGMAFLSKPPKCMDIIEHLDALTSVTEPEPYRVLVIDDEPNVAQYHASILEDAGMLTHVTQDPAAAIELLRESRPELVLTDMYMPGCTGRELAQVIRQMPEFVSMPIVYLSSETDIAKQRSALSVGADGFLIKPIEPRELVSAVAVRAERMRTLRALMVRDSLTGLFNHTATKQFLEGAVAGARRRKGTVCFGMIDVDHFKGVNDTYGHPVGDQVLLALSRVLRQRLRQNDLVGRYGGEEFAVVLVDVCIAKARDILDELRVDFSNIKFWANDREFSVTFSGGVAQFPGCDGTDELCEQADNALYAAKRGGRNRIAWQPAGAPP